MPQFPPALAIQQANDATPGTVPRISGANKILQANPDGTGATWVDPAAVSGLEGPPGPPGSLTADFILTSNDTLSGTATRDGVTLTTGMVALAVGQTTASQNGRYTVAAGTWTNLFANDAAVAAAIGVPVFVKPEGLSVPAEGANYQLVSGSTLAAAKQYAKAIGSGPAASIPVDLIATSNITQSGTGAVVDGITLTAGMRVLSAAQTVAAQRDLLVVAAGAWTRPTDYNSDAQMLVGQQFYPSQGTYLKNVPYLLRSGSTIAGVKVFAPVKPQTEVVLSDAPWFWPADGSSQETIKLAVEGYMSTVAVGGTVRLGPGIYGFTSTWKFPRGWSMRGCSQVASTAKLLDVNQTPCDTLYFQGLLGFNGESRSDVRGVTIQNPWGLDWLDNWAPSSGAFSLGQYIYPTRASSTVLKLIAKSGNTGALEPIGELTPSFTYAKLLGTANAPAQVLLIPVVGGYPGAGLTYKMSVDAGVTQSATQTTVPSANVVSVDAVCGTSLGASFKVQLNNKPYAAVAHATVANFSQPAVQSTGAPHSVSAFMDSIAGYNQGQYVLGSTGGLWLVQSVDGAGVSLSLWNVGANGAAAPTTVIPTGTTLTIVYAPAPRIEVIGAPPLAGYIVDAQTYGGPLGSIACQFQIGKGNPAERWIFGGTVTSGADQPTTGGAGFYDYAIPATALTLRLHTGLYLNSGSWSYFTPSFEWTCLTATYRTPAGTPQSTATTIADGACTWEAYAAPTCVRIETGFMTIADTTLQGGAFGLIGENAAYVNLEGQNTWTEQVTASIWFLTGQISNANTLSGTQAMFGAFVGLIHDGGVALSTSGMLGLNSESQAGIFLAGCIGVDLGCAYAELAAPVLLTRTSGFFDRLPTGISVNNLEVAAGFMGSTGSAPYGMELYRVVGGKISGVSIGGTVAAIKYVSTCTNFNVDGCSNPQGLPMFDAWPTSGHGFIPDNGGTSYAIGATMYAPPPNRSFAIATDTALATDASGNVTSTGATAAVVTVGAQLPGTLIVYEQGGAGALTFTASGVTIQTALGAGGATTGQYQTRALFWKSATVVRIS